MQAQQEFSHIIVFIVLAALFVAVTLAIAKLVRGRSSETDIDTDDGFGEQPVTSVWLTLDHRHYMLALLLVLFIAELALLFPIALVFRDSGQLGLWALISIVVVLLVGFLYVRANAPLEWVRKYTAERIQTETLPEANSEFPVLVHSPAEEAV